MKDPFFVDEYKERGIEVVVPDSNDQKTINNIIFKELIHGRYPEDCIQKLLSCCKNLQKLKIDGILLGCTELSILAKYWSLDLPLVDSTQAHCKYVLEWMANT